MSNVLLWVAMLGVGGLVGHWLTRRSSNKRDQSTDTTTAARLPKPHRMPLLVLVVVGTIAVTVLGVALFGWLAWLLSHQPAPWHDPNGWRAWVSQVDGAKMFDSARTTATLLAIIGVGGAALVAYRRQDSVERSHQVAIDAQETAVKQFKLDSDKYELDRERHQLETERRTDDRERELRSRFTTIAEQLGSNNFGVRHAGAYALASLADDWHRFGNDTERQVCVDLLCAQLRSPRQREEIETEEYGTHWRDSPEDIEVRKTMVALIRSHRPVTGADDPNNWKCCSIDLSGADLSTFILNETDLSSANLDDANLSHTRLVGADLSEAMMARVAVAGTNFTEANLTRATLASASFSDTAEEADRAVFDRAELYCAYLTSSFLPGAKFNTANLQGAIIHNARLHRASFADANLVDASLIHSTLDGVNFRNADLRGTNFAYADVSGAKFTRAQHNDRTNWADGVLPDGLAPIDLTS
jgi:uncharacterized protein YjbI with pentapeptide repeats